ncbi:hypothetical protein K7862_24135 [Streptomyces sp. PLK6-54]|uniref:non-specific serine/threonine protein kinase n=1 Tax=Actinacidiphila acidipaludis TaxID=2873382 RepID=A0ABS7QBZ4_9ACTN|nr:hypothetical protein [Streptomyces acidipaludis]
MPPEQWRGGPVTPAADMYAFGATLFTLLTGGPPFPGPTAAAWMHQHLGVQPPRLPGQAMQIPEQLGDLVDRLLAKAPIERPGAAETLRSLRETIGESPAHPATLVIRPAESPGAESTRLAPTPELDTLTAARPASGPAEGSSTPAPPAPPLPPHAPDAPSGTRDRPAPVDSPSVPAGLSRRTLLLVGAGVAAAAAGGVAAVTWSPSDHHGTGPPRCELWAARMLRFAGVVTGPPGSGDGRLRSLWFAALSPRRSPRLIRHHRGNASYARSGATRHYRPAGADMLGPLHQHLSRCLQMLVGCAATAAESTVSHTGGAGTPAPPRKWKRSTAKEVVLPILANHHKGFPWASTHTSSSALSAPASRVGSALPAAWARRLSAVSAVRVTAPW